MIGITWRSWQGGAGLEDLDLALLDRNIFRYHEIELAGPLHKQVCVTHLEQKIVHALPSRTDLRTISRRGRSGHSFRTLQFVQACGVSKRLSREGPVKPASRPLTMHLSINLSDHIDVCRAARSVPFAPLTTPAYALLGLSNFISSRCGPPVRGARSGISQLLPARGGTRTV